MQHHPYSELEPREDKYSQQNQYRSEIAEQNTGVFELSTGRRDAITTQQQSQQQPPLFFPLDFLSKQQLDFLTSNPALPSSSLSVRLPHHSGVEFLTFLEMKGRLLSLDLHYRIDESIIEALDWIWEYSRIQKIWKNRNHGGFCMSDSIGYFLSRSPQLIFTPHYEPTFEDFLRIYQPTIGSHDVILEMPQENLSLTVHDVQFFYCFSFF
jgi:hypothetical protein